MKRLLFAVFLVACVLCGCGTADALAPTPVTKISQAKAIELGLQFARQGGIDMEALPATPSSPRAEMMTYPEALSKYFDSGVPAVQDPQRLVWIVTTSGLWRDAFPRPTGMPTPELLTRFFVLLDAETGEYIGSGAKP